MLMLLRRLALGRAEPISGIAKPRFANGIARLTERRSDDLVEAHERWLAACLPFLYFTQFWRLHRSHLFAFSPID
jgi:hypothetical protein